MHNADEMFDRDLASALDVLDYPVRPVSVDAVIQRARGRAAQRRWRFVAAAVVMLAASAAAALPGSPVRRWVVSLLRGAASADAPQSRAPGRAPPPVPAASPDMRGVVTFIGDSAEVIFTAWQDSGDVVIRFVAAAELRIRSAAQPVAFQVRPAGILVNNAGSHASYEVDISDGAADVRVVVNGGIIFERRSGRVVIGPAPRADGAYVVGLQPQRQR